MNKEQIEDYYKGEAGKKYQELRHSNDPDIYEYVARIRTIKIQPYLKPSDDILEYGVGTGWNLVHLNCKSKSGYDVGNFLSPEASQITFYDNLDSVKPSNYDAILCHHTLEHVYNPPEVIQNIKHLLKEGGRLLLYVPFELSSKNHTFNPNNPHKHLYSWTPQTLGALVSNLGFNIESVGLKLSGYERYAAKLAKKLKLNFQGYKLLLRLIQLVRPEKEIYLIATKSKF